MPILIKDVTGAKEPIELKAPIVTDASDDGVRELQEFIDVLKWSRNTDVAAAEAARLEQEGYWPALSAYIQGAITDPQAQQELKNASSPETLVETFKRMAAGIRTTLISEVVILSSDMLENGPLSKEFGNSRRYDVPYVYHRGKFLFGFFQVKGQDDDGRGGSTTFATFTVDGRCLNVLKAHNPADFLQELQTVMTYVNHDMLHHLTSTYINRDSVVQDWHRNGQDLPLHRWGHRLPRHAGSEAYEDWAQIAHEKTRLGDQRGVDQIAGHMDCYFEKLKCIKDASLGADAQTRDSINYFADVMAHALSRVFPLNHPVMQRCLDHMIAVDSDPAQSLDDCLMTARTRLLREGDVSSSGTPETKSKLILRKCQAAFSILHLYGFRVLDAADRENERISDPKILRLMELIKVTQKDIGPHVPVTNGPMASLQKSAAGITLDMAVQAKATVEKLLKPK
jgi:hypothetical protein